LVPVATTILLAYQTIKMRISNIELAQRLAQSSIDKDMLTIELDRAYEDKKLVESQEFMLFLNKTRDDAFEYIENVQQELERFDKTISPILDYHQTYGTVLGETVDWKNMESVNKAYKRLKKIMPESAKNN
jgi:hypothetical protein